jgi:hypothetical protein
VHISQIVLTGADAINQQETLRLSDTVQSQISMIQTLQSELVQVSDTVLSEDDMGVSDGRITLTSATPWLTSSVTAATSVFFTPAEGQKVKIYDGSNVVGRVFAEMSQATTDATKSPAACVANSNYDLFVWDDSGTLRCTRGPAWSTDTTRGTGAGTTELHFTVGMLMNANAITNGPAADRGTYVGTVRTNASSQIDMIFGGAGGAGGESTILGIWNMYNRRKVTLTNFDNTDSYAYTTAAFRLKNNNNANKISFVVGWQGDGLFANNSVWVSSSAVNNLDLIGIGLNSTTAIATGSNTGVGRSATAGLTTQGIASYSTMIPLGFNYVAPLEYSTASGTTTWYGDNGGVLQVSAFLVTTMF